MKDITPIIRPLVQAPNSPRLQEGGTSTRNVATLWHLYAIYGQYLKNSNDMNIVEKEAKDFIRDFYSGVKINNLENLKDRLTSKLYQLTRDRDKLDFLKILRQDSLTQKVEHLKKCQTPDCNFPKDRDYGLFVIDQEIDSINEYYDFEPKSKDKFSAEEESTLHSKLNDIIERLEKQGLGQQIIYDEIESLKNHFNLGKRNWFQLLKGKVIDLTIEKALEKTIVVGIYEMLREEYKDMVKMIE